jgi:hypothetical protein
MGGDLIEGSSDPTSPLYHGKWFAHLPGNLTDIVDACAAHVYWSYDAVGRFEERLRTTREILGGLEKLKGMPALITEYGTRGKDRKPNTIDDPGNFDNGTDMPPMLGQTNIAAFQHAWFLIRAAQYGFAGVVKWDCYHGKYDRGSQAYYAIGPPGDKGWPLYPSYFLLRLFTATTAPG